MGRRYESRPKKSTAHFKNRSKEYIERRDRKFIRHFTTPILEHPNAEQIMSLNTVAHTWTSGDKFFKLAHEHYGSSKYWWVIAWFNQKPTEGHMEHGDVIEIPQPLEKVLALMEV